MTLFYCAFVQTFSNALKSLAGTVTVLIILRTLYIHLLFTKKLVAKI